MPRFLRKAALLGCMVLAAVVVSPAAPWRPIGPDGGDARSLAADPRNPDRILLGTSSSQLFVSNDGGYTWSRLARVGDGDHYVVDHIVFNPAHPETIYAAAWYVILEVNSSPNSETYALCVGRLNSMHECQRS